jgi:uncharacterized protein (TIGR03435 family)
MFLSRNKRKIRALGMMFGLLTARAALPSSLCEAQQTVSPSQAAGFTFAAVSIKPSNGDGPMSFGPTATGYSARNTPLVWMIMQAFYPRSMAYWRQDRLLNAPNWVQSTKFDLEAKLDEKDIERFAKLSNGERERALSPYLQAMLHDRCNLQIVESSSVGEYYALSIGPKGLKIARDASASADGFDLPDGGRMKPIYSDITKQHGFLFSNVSMTDFAAALTGLSDADGYPVQDETGMAGRFNFTLLKIEVQSPDGSAGGESTDPSPSTRWDIGAIGLRLRQKKGDMPSLSVIHIEKPSAD